MKIVLENEVLAFLSFSLNSSGALVVSLINFATNSVLVMDIFMSAFFGEGRMQVHSGPSQVEERLLAESRGSGNSSTLQAIINQMESLGW